jgi:hypothetical protein
VDAPTPILSPGYILLLIGVGRLVLQLDDLLLDKMLSIKSWISKN